MFRRVAALLMLLLTVLQLGYQLGWVMYYAANKEAITRNYCINKARPALHCDGKCYLARKLRATDERDSRNGAERDFRAKFDSTASVLPPDEPCCPMAKVFASQRSPTKLAFAPRKDGVLEGFPHTVFHPPTT